MPAQFLSEPEQDALSGAVAKAKAFKFNGRDAALRGEAFQRTPLYADIPWELSLPAEQRTRTTVDAIIASARHAAL